jgi:hypothetical protein
MSQLVWRPAPLFSQANSMSGGFNSYTYTIPPDRGHAILPLRTWAIFQAPPSRCTVM